MSFPCPAQHVVSAYYTALLARNTTLLRDFSLGLLLIHCLLWYAACLKEVPLHEIYRCQDNVQDVIT
jgi:hypothetical protein